ncbi:hypothetical protein D9V96_009220 [Zobellia laminariae]|uniref:Uncharacterized protein n=1 Tax=Zobellia barbeyronii TaxID=2748009 RepID=A0ABS5W997_9FLAO|nr:hypothetical protein [Zobellia barbeyronii]MBT2159991.1 hypothetical protein [Zobellia barbeyronii]
MSTGNPNKFKILEDIKEGVEAVTNSQEKEDVARLYKNKGSRVSKELSFKTKNDKSKWS